MLRNVTELLTKLLYSMELSYLSFYNAGFFLNVLHSDRRGLCPFCPHLSSPAPTVNRPKLLTNSNLKASLAYLEAV